MKTYLVYVDDKFFMQAPMSTIAEVFSPRKEAIQRVEREFAAGEVISQLHFNGRCHFAKSALIQTAIEEK